MTEETPAPRSDVSTGDPAPAWGNLPSKWYLAAAFWAAQTLFVLGVGLLTVAHVQEVEGPKEMYPIPSWAEIEGVARLPDFWGWTLLIAVSIAAAQAVFLWPVARPRPKQQGGVAMWLSLATAGLAIGALSSALVIAVLHVVDEYLTAAHPPFATEWFIVVCAVPGWIAGTLLLSRFAKNDTRETRLARISARLFLGTMIEVAALMPLDVMIRRKTNCYCFAGTYIALAICGSVGLFALGPAIFLPALAKRRRRWHTGRCDACGYDMSNLLKADRCPECGAGWRAQPGEASPAGEASSATVAAGSKGDQTDRS